MKVERIHILETSPYLSQSADKLIREQRGTDTDQAVVFDEQKQREKSAHDFQESAQHQKFKAKPTEVKAEITQSDGDQIALDIVA